MTTLHLMVGLPCSGKTTAARELEEAHSALRLTTDEWHVRLFGDDFSDPDDPVHEQHNERHSVLEQLLWQCAARALSLGVNVILDFGFWTRAEREQFRTRARELAVDFRIHYAEAPEQVLLERLEARNANLPAGAFHIDPAELRAWFALFEPPSASELS
jgi:hypothetical protein